MFPARSVARRVAWGGQASSLSLVLFAWLLRLWRIGDLPLIRDEAYFYQWGQHLDWAYYDHPAGIGVLAWLSSALAGGSEFGIRWLNAALGTICVVLIAWVGRSFFDRKVAWLGSALVAVGAPYLLTSRFLYTDTLHLASVLLTLGAFWRLAQHNGGRLSDGLGLGLSLALMANTKYTAYLVAAALAMATLLDHRRLLRGRATWLAVGLGFLGLLPVLVWNARHEWASFAWQLGHLGLSSPGGEVVGLIPQVVRNLRHAVVYFTLPLALLVFVGLTGLRGPAQRLLILVAIMVTVPVALSPANSPRNLTTGAVLFLLLSAAQLLQWRASIGRASARKLLEFTLVGDLVAVAVYGVGSLLALTYGVPSLPQSSVVQDILYEAVGWGSVAARLPGDGAVLTIDYSLAGPIAYYTARPTVSAWPQYRLWGTPDLDEVLVIALTYLSADVIDTRLRSAYRDVNPLAPVAMGSYRGKTKWLHLWQATGLSLPPDELLDRVDFLTLYAESR